MNPSHHLVSGVGQVNVAVDWVERDACYAIYLGVRAQSSVSRFAERASAGDNRRRAIRLHVIYIRGELVALRSLGNVEIAAGIDGQSAGIVEGVVARQPCRVLGDVPNAAKVEHRPAQPAFACLACKKSIQVTVRWIDRKRGISLIEEATHGSARGPAAAADRRKLVHVAGKSAVRNIEVGADIDIAPCIARNGYRMKRPGASPSPRTRKRQCGEAAA